MLECDVECRGTEDDLTNYYECVMGVELDLTDEQIAQFNNDQKNKAYIQRHTEKASKINGTVPYLYLFKVYPEEDPTENAGPFESREEATGFLNLAWAMNGDNTQPVVPNILEK